MKLLYFSEFINENIVEEFLDEDVLEFLSNNYPDLDILDEAFMDKIKTAGNIVANKLKKLYDRVKSSKNMMNIKLQYFKTQQEYNLKLAKQYKAEGKMAQSKAAFEKAKNIGKQKRMYQTEMNKKIAAMKTRK